MTYKFTVWIVVWVLGFIELLTEWDNLGLGYDILLSIFLGALTIALLRTASRNTQIMWKKREYNEILGATLIIISWYLTIKIVKLNLPLPPWQSTLPIEITCGGMILYVVLKKTLWNFDGASCSPFLRRRIKNRGVSVKDLLNRNDNLWRVSFKYYPCKEVIQYFTPKCINKSDRGNELFSIQIRDETFHFVTFNDSTTTRKYYEWIPAGISNADEAVSYLLGISEEEYEELEFES